jgi:hypothetical protein
MTFAPPEVSPAATRRIGVANAVLWIAGSIVLVVVGATAAYAFVVAPFTGGGLLGGDYPWEADQPLVATQTVDVWSADASGVIRIPAAEFTEPLEAEVAGGGPLDLYRTDPDDGQTSTDDYFFPVPIGYLSADGTQIIVPTGDDLELWVGAGQAWRLRLTPLDATPMDDSGASGKGNAYLIYAGDAVSANFTYIGDGIFFVTIYTAFAQEYPITETDDVSQRVSWDPGSYVVIQIESSSDGGAWAIDIDELAPSTPAATPTPTPTETP